MSTQNQAAPIDHDHEMMKRVKIIMAKERMFDVILISGVDGKRIPAHRLMLAAASEYFETMFSGTMKEATEKEVTINDIDGKTLQSLVTYCYTGELNLQEDNAEKILSSAHHLQFPIVVDRCAEFVEDQLNSSNCLGIKYFAEQFNCTELERQAQSYICENFNQVAESEEFFKLNADQLDQLLARDDLNVEMEEDIFRCLMSWVQRDETNRKKDIPQLLLNVRIPLMDSKFIIDNVKSVCKENGCSELFIEAYEWKLSPNDVPEINSKSIKPRTYSAGCLLAICDGRFEKYCPKLHKWMSLTEMTLLEDNFVNVVLWKKKLVIACGCGRQNCPKTVKYWDVDLKSWKELCPLNSDRYGVELAVLGDSLYAIGGDSDLKPVDIVERLDSLTGSWQSLASMPLKLNCVQAAVYNGFIYVEGEDDNEIGHLLIYDPQLDKWTDLGVTSRDPKSLFVIKGDLYALRNNEIQKYNKNINTWTTCVNNCYGIFMACSYNNRIMAVIDEDGILLKEYKPNTNKFINLDPFPMSNLHKLICIPSRII